MTKVQELENSIKDIKAAMVDAESKEMLADPLAEAQRQLDAEKKKQTASEKKTEKKSTKKRVVSKKKKAEEVEADKKKKKEVEERKKKAEEERKKKVEEEKKKKAEKEKKRMDDEIKKRSSGSKELDLAIKKAVFTLNKKRYALKEIKNQKTKEFNKVHHSPEYRNSRIIRSRVDKIFDSSIHDITNSRKKKDENKEIVKKAEQLKDLFTILLNEIDAIINSTDKSDIDNIIGLIKGLVKQSVKNDPKDKYKKIKWMQDLLDKYKIQ